MTTLSTTNEQQAANAFNKQSALFDELYSKDTIIQYKRDRVRKHITMLLTPNSHMLELNAGTGEDALYFGEEGYSIHATDISPGMLAILSAKVSNKQLHHKITHELCSYTSLENLTAKGPYDYVFSNFAGLNCTDRLDKVLSSLSSLTKRGGVVTLVILPKFCLWEFLLIGKGKFKTAFRRFIGKKGTRAHVEGGYFTCWYYNPSYVRKKMAADFELLLTEGLCTLVPPSYITHFAEKYPRIYAFLVRMENRFRYTRPWRAIGDYYIISFRRK